MAGRVHPWYGDHRPSAVQQLANPPLEASPLSVMLPVSIQGYEIDT